MLIAGSHLHSYEMFHSMVAINSENRKNYCFAFVLCMRKGSAC